MITVFSLLTGVLFCQVNNEEVERNGYVTFHYSNGKISSEGIMKNGKPDGYWKTYYNTGVLKSEGNRKNFLLDGEWIFYDNLGDTTKKINFVLGKKNGFIYSYYPGKERTGKIAGIEAKELYVNDKLEGLSYYYYENGKLKEIIEYSNNKKNGESIEYDKDGRIITKKQYRKGVLVEREKINRYNEKGEKHGVWKEFYSNGRVKNEKPYIDGLLNGYYKEFDKSGQLIVSLRYQEGKLIEEENIEEEHVEIINEYDEKGNVIYSGSFRNGNNKVGIHREYNSDGEVKNSMIFSNNGVLLSRGIITKEGSREGEWKDFYLSGNIKAEGKYKNNKREGKWKFYFENGQVEQTGEFKDGKYNGKWTWYYSDGTVAREENFYNGREEGLFTEYNTDGCIITEGEYFDGEKEGEWIYRINDYEEKGSYVTGLKDGKWIQLYDDGTLKFEGSYIQGNADGKHRYYYDNGILKEERYYIAGNKEKHWKKYDREGNLIVTISYKDDKEYRINGIKVDLNENKDVSIVNKD